MKWEGRERSTNVEDRRGLGPGKMAAGGGSIGLIILFLLYMFTGNKEVGQLLQQQQQQAQVQQQQQPVVGKNPRLTTRHVNSSRLFSKAPKMSGIINFQNTLVATMSRLD